MVRLTARISDASHDKLRGLAYKERRGQQAILVEWIERVLADVEVTKEESE